MTRAPLFDTDTIRRLIPGTDFNYDWTSKLLPVFQEYIPKGLTRILEIGTWEARTTCYLATHHLDLNGGRMLTVDPYSYAHARLFSGEMTYRANADHSVWNEDNIVKVRERADENLKALENFLRDQRTKQGIQQDGYLWAERKPSHEALMGLCGPWNHNLYFDTFDLIFIDGSHLLCDVTLDLFLSMRLVNRGKKEGTLIVVDDFPKTEDAGGVFLPAPKSKEEREVLEACDYFQKCFRNRLKVLHYDAPAAIFKVIR